MKAITTTLLIISFSLIALAQSYKPHNQFKNDLMRQKLKGNITMVTEYEYNATGDSLVWKGVTKYNAKGNAEEFNTYSAAGELLSKTTFKYNDSDKLMEEDRYKADGTLNVRTTVRYDEKGNKIEEYNYDPAGVLFVKVLSKFDGKGNRIVKDSYNEFGSLFLKCNSKFDDQGNEISSMEYDSHHGLKFSTTYDYDGADAYGNWLKRTTYKNDEPTSVTTREIR